MMGTLKWILLLPMCTIIPIQSFSAPYENIPRTLFDDPVTNSYINFKTLTNVFAFILLKYLKIRITGLEKVREIYLFCMYTCLKSKNILWIFVAS